MTGAFAGIRVLDLSTAIPGAYCSKLLADHGADVIKIEPPGGDPWRMAPPVAGGQAIGDQRSAIRLGEFGSSGLFAYLNTNKRSFVINDPRLAAIRGSVESANPESRAPASGPAPAGRGSDSGLADGVEATSRSRLPFDAETGHGDRELLDSLLGSADVVVVDQTIGAVDLPIGPDTILTSVTAFGSSGPLAGQPGCDLVAMAMSGIVNSTPGNVDDLDRQPPLRIGGRQGDYAAGLVAAFSTAVALLDRQRTGQGQALDVSEVEVLASFMFFDTASYVYDPTSTYLRRSADRRVTGGYPRTSIGIWPCQDGYVCIAVREQHHFLRLVKAVGDPEWSKDERFMSRAARGQNREVLNPLILAWTMAHTVQEIWHLAQVHDIPITPCSDVRQLVESDQLASRDYFVDFEQPGLGAVRIPRGPIQFSASPWQLRRPAPVLGEHTAEVQGEGRKAKGEGRTPEVDRSLRPSDPPTILLSRPRALVPSRPLPLAGLRVVEFAAAAAVPFATFWLAALGAEVLKIESYEHPDVARRLEPYADGIEGHNRSGMFNTKGFNKRSCTINISDPAGLDLALELAALSDIVVENFSFKVMQRYGLTYERLRAIRPDIILLSCSALGRTGPARQTPGYNENISAISGLASVTGYPGGPPGLPGSTWGDYISGATMAFAIAAAVHYRNQTGQGQHLDFAMAEALAVQIPEAILDQTMNGATRGRVGNDDDLASPHGMFRCQGDDQWVAIGVFSQAQWLGLCGAIGELDLATDERFGTIEGRRARSDEIARCVTNWTRSRGAEEAGALLRAHGVPAGPVLKAPDRLAHPHFQARGFYREIDHPETGPRAASFLPFSLSGHPVISYRHAPVFGQDNDYVFGGLLGLSDEQFAELAGRGIAY